MTRRPDEPGFSRDEDLERARGGGRPASADMEGTDPQSVGADPVRYPANADDEGQNARALQENRSQPPLEVEPGSDADQANEAPHVG